MLTRYEVQKHPDGITITEDHILTDDQMVKLAEVVSEGSTVSREDYQSIFKTPVRKRPSKAAQRREAVWMIQADMEDLADLYEDEVASRGEG